MPSAGVARRSPSDTFGPHQARILAVGRLAGGMAHDFNNLFQVILGRASLLAELLPPEGEAMEHLSEIMASGRRAQTLIHELMSFGRQVPGSPRLVTVDDAVRSVTRTIEARNESHIALSVSLHADAAAVLIDPTQLEGVLLRLVANARDAMARGGTLTIATTVIALDDERLALHPFVTRGRFASITITDTGHGMDDTTLARIFEPFYTTKESDSASGLGLPAAYGIVKQAGGFMLVESEPGVGSRFEILLPLALATVTQTAPEGDTAIPVPSQTHSGRTILVVEDADGVRKLVVNLLRADGHNVLEARDSAEAHFRCELHSAEIDLLVTDVSLPGKSGVELADELRPQYARLRVLYLSGDEHSLPPEQAGVTACLEKPFGLTVLRERVRALLDQ
jgi:nitrogen-specific signal transduction histidine kinase